MNSLIHIFFFPLCSISQKLSQGQFSYLIWESLLIGCILYGDGCQNISHGRCLALNWSLKPATDWATSVGQSLSLENQSDSQSTKPLSIAQWSTALHYGLTLQHHDFVRDSVEFKILNVIEFSCDDAEASDCRLLVRWKARKWGKRFRGNKGLI